MTDRLSEAAISVGLPLKTSDSRSIALEVFMTSWTHFFCVRFLVAFFFVEAMPSDDALTVPMTREVLTRPASLIAIQSQVQNSHPRSSVTQRRSPSTQYGLYSLHDPAPWS